MQDPRIARVDVRGVSYTLLEQQTACMSGARKNRAGNHSPHCHKARHSPLSWSVRHAAFHRHTQEHKKAATFLWTVGYLHYMYLGEQVND